MADSFTPNRTLTSDEYARLAMAVGAYTGSPTGDVYVAMQTKYPHDVLGVTATRKEAEDLIKASKLKGYEVYGPIRKTSSSAYSDAIYLSGHDGGCQNLTLMPTVRGQPGPPLVTDVVTMTLDIAWKPGGPDSPDDRQAPNHLVYDLPRTLDTIFLTRNSREGFMYPRYQIVFGARKVDVMRKQMDEPQERFP